MAEQVGQQQAGPAAGRQDLLLDGDAFRLLSLDPRPQWICEPATGAFLEVNEAAVREYGFSRDELLAMKREDLRAPDDPTAPPLLAGEVRHRLKDGRAVVASVSSRPIEYGGKQALIERASLDGGARPDLAGGNDDARELARLSRIYEALSQVNQAIVRVTTREELFSEACRVLVQAGGFRLAWVGWLDPATHEVAIAARYGDTSGYLEGLSVYADDRPEGRGPTGTCIREGKPYICNDFLADPRTLPWRAAATRSRWRASAAFPLRQVGEVRGALMVYAREPGFFGAREVSLLVQASSDVSFALDNLEHEAQRLRAETALRELSARLRLAVQASNVGLWDWDLRTNKVYLSPEWKLQLGYGDQELSSELEEWHGRVHPDDLPHLLDVVQAHLASDDETYEAQFRLRHKDGSYRQILARGSKRRDDAGEVVRLLGSHVDLTDYVELQARFLQAQKMESVGRLAAGVAHDFNNLLSVVLSYAQLLLQELKPGDPMREQLGEIRAAGLRAAELTGQLLAFSRRQVLKPRIVDLGQILAGMDKMLRPLIGEEIELKTSFPEPGTAKVSIDPGQLEQVIMNLAVNARDAMPEGGTLSIGLGEAQLDEAFAREHAGAKSGRQVVLLVSDTGTGMDEATQAHIFEPFFTTKEQGKGTGLGLSTVFGIVSQSGGTIRVDSQPGHGTTFKVYLPAVGPEVSFPAVDAVAPEATELRGTETILVVDDEPQVRKVMKTILERSGYRVLEAASGGDALIAMEHEPGVALLLTDVMMPHLSGPQLAARLEALHPGLKVLYVSGNTDDSGLMQQVLASRVAFLQKPILPVKLLTRIRALLDLPKPAAAPGPPAQQVPAGPVAKAPRLRVLAIDDELVMQRLIVHSLRDYDVVAVGGAEEALARLAAGERFDVILCDLHLKTMSGAAFHQALQQRWPGDAGRVLFLTGGATTPEDEQFLKSVANRVLQKPVEVKRLRAAVAALAGEQATPPAS